MIRCFCLIATVRSTQAVIYWNEALTGIGVLWSGDHLFPGTVETLELLRSNGKQVVFVTNNSTKSRADYKKKLETLGIPSSTVRPYDQQAGKTGY